METILPISLKLNFTENTLGCYGLSTEKLTRVEHKTREMHPLKVSRAWSQQPYT